jgi:hypothetical protein
MPALSHFWIRRVMRLSPTLCFTKRINHSWLTATPGRADTRNNASFRVAFHPSHGVGARDQNNFAAQWLACTHPYRRFADTLAVACARLGADVVCYAFIAVDSHHFLLTGLPAHDQMFA